MEQVPAKNEMASHSPAWNIITSYNGPKVRIMEVCGTHTHEIFRLGIRHILPPAIELISGPGCPVCVTPVSFIDEALLLALEHHVTLCTFGDLVRVPGTKMNLADARSSGANIRIVYTPLDAYLYAKNNPEQQTVFLSVGFETTVPAACLAVKKAYADGLTNFSLLTANKTMKNAYRALKRSANAFLYPGHVNAITGTALCESLTQEGISGVITGFTANELLTALAVILTKTKEGRPFFYNCYPRVVTQDGSKTAQSLIAEIMEPCASEWRGLGIIPQSGLKLQPIYKGFDARLRFHLPALTGRSDPACRCGDVLQGKCKPTDCKIFGNRCRPEHPIGACMVSNEGACSAYYQYGGNL
jgi:hydrogenase expression/formation protein HypD